MTQRNMPDRGAPPVPVGGSQQPKETNTNIRQIIVDGNVELLVQVADQVGRQLAEQKLTTNQIRNVFGTARQIQMRWSSNAPKAYREAVLLRPKLAYFAEREKQAKGGRSQGMETLKQVLEPALKLLTEDGQPNQERYDRFVDLFEAIVAYHKSYGGR